MKTLFFSLILISSVLFSQDNGNLIITSENFKDNSGYAIAKLFRVSDDIFGEPFIMQINKIDEKKAKWEFKDIPFGIYAIYIFHDKNSNKQLDHNIFRFPKEPMAFSGNFTLSLFSGKPTFDKMKFNFLEDNSTYIINF